MFYAINKSKNISSFNEIKKFANENNIKKIGHCGFWFINCSNKWTY